MKKTITLIYLFIVLGCSLGTKEGVTTDNTRDLIDESYDSKHYKEFIDSLAKCEIPKISLPFYLDSTNSYYPEMHGMINPHAREDIMDETFFPPVPDLYFKSCFELCPIDGCKAERAVLAISVPHDKTELLAWVTRKAHEFTVQSINDSSAHIDETNNLSSSKQICDYYIDKIRNHYRAYVSSCLHSEESPNEQFGRMIAPVWSKGDYYTFIVSDWYDNLSCGNNSKVSYLTVNSQTGKELMLLDIIEKRYLRPFSNLLLKYLTNYNGKWLDSTFRRNAITVDTGMALIAEIDGCALLNEGLVLYFHPYTIESGAEGQYNAVIPYDEIRNENIQFRPDIDTFLRKAGL